MRVMGDARAQLYERVREAAAAGAGAARPMRLEEAFPPDEVEKQGATWFALAAAEHQVVVARAKAGELRRPRRDVASWLARYDEGESAVDIARAAAYPPCLLAKEILAEKLVGKTASAAAASQTDKKTVQAGLRDPDSLSDARLRREVVACCDEDIHFSPASERARHAAGALHEFRLMRELQLAGISFESEAALRQRGFARTPDVLLVVPIAVRLSGDDEAAGSGDSRRRVVRWIDSKAMFGDEHTHNVEHRHQILAYVNRFGPGLVIYWFGFDAARVRDTYPDVCVASEMPRDVVSLSS